MADLAGFAATTFVAIFAIVNPVGAMTFFVVLTRSYPPVVKKRVIEKAVLAATVTLLIFAFVGNNIFLFFGTSIPAFRIAGGILLFSIAFSMMQGERSRTQLTAQDRQEALEREAIGIVPLGIPMLAGPGAITTVIVLMAEATSPCRCWRKKMGNPIPMPVVKVVGLPSTALRLKVRLMSGAQ